MSISALPWDLLAAYRAVCRTGTLSGAARSLGLSQPTVRRQIETLEAMVGSALFTRGAAGLEPVVGHEALQREVDAMEAAATGFARLASAGTDEVRGVVRITAPAVFAAELLMPILAGLRRQWPALEIELSTSNAVENLLRREADIAVRLVRPQQEALVAQRVAPVVFGLFAAPGSAGAAFAGCAYDAVADSGLMIVQDRMRTFADAFATLGLLPPKTAALRTDDDLAQLAAIRAGVGIGATHLSIAEREGLVPICADIRIPSDVFVVMHGDLRRHARVRVTFDALVAGLGRNMAAATQT